jgi:AcrR family transcriptional regulator
LVTTRDQILDGAAEVMSTLGLGRATTREIAHAAGLSEAALYKHFRDKDELFLCVLSERLPEQVVVLMELQSRVGRRTVRTNLEELAGAALELYDRTWPFVAALFAEPALLAKHSDGLRRSGKSPRKGIELLAAYLRAEQRIGRVAPGVDTEAAASLLLGACMQRACMRRFSVPEDDADDDRRFVRGTVRSLLRGLTPSAPSDGSHRQVDPDRHRVHPG